MCDVVDQSLSSRISHCCVQCFALLVYVGLDFFLFFLFQTLSLLLRFIYAGMIVVFVPQRTAKCTLYGLLWLYVGRGSIVQDLDRTKR